MMARRSAAVVLRALLAALACVAGAARAADEVPRVPCGVSPVPAYAALASPPNVRVWSGKDARGWTPPACVGGAAADADIMVAVAGSFRHEGEIDALLARVGAMSAKKGVRYWSTTDKRWLPLVTEVYACSGPDPEARRSDFAPAQITAGQILYYTQSDNRTSGKNLYRERVLAVDRERLMIETENVSPLRKMMITLFEPGQLRTAYVLERLAPGVWGFYSLTRAQTASSLVPVGGEASYINRAVALYRHVAGIPTDQEPPAAR